MAVERGTGTIAQGLAGLSTPSRMTTVPAPNPTAEALSYLSNPDALRAGSAAEMGGNEQDQIILNLRNMDYGQLVETYGLEVANRRNAILQSDTLFRQTFETDRGNLTRAGDAALGVTAGFAGMVGSLEALGAGAVLGANAGTAVADATNTVTEAIRSLQSYELQGRREASAELMALDSRDNQRQYERDIESGGSRVVAGLRSIGRGITNTLETYGNDLALSMDIVAEGLGSLGPSVKMAQGAARLAQPLVRSQAARAAQVAAVANPTRLNTARAALYANAENIAIAGTVGLAESGGVYSQAVTVVMEMSDEELMQTSESYRALRQGGASVDEAKREVANDSGLLAAAVQLPVAMVAGLGVAAFERSPLGVGNIADGLKTLGTQTIEEGFQSATGQLSTNFAIQQNADETQSIAEGVGEGLVQGAIGGLGMAGVTQGPALAVQSLGAGARLTGQAVQARLDAVDRRADNASDVGTRATQNRINDAEVNIATVSESMPDTELSNILSLNQDEIETIPLSVLEVRRPADGQEDAVPNSRLNTIQRVVNAVSNGTLTGPKVQEASLYVYGELQRLQAIGLNELPTEIQSLPEENPTRVAYEQAQKDLLTIAENPEYKAIIDIAETAEQPQYEVMPPITRDLVQETIAIARSNPAGVNLNLVDEIIKSAGMSNESDLPDGPGFSLTPQETEILNNVRFMLSGRETNLSAKTEAEQERVDAINATATEDQKKIEPRRPYDIVKDEIHVDGKRTTAKGRMLPSLNDYLRDISSSMARGGKEIQTRFGEPTTATDSLAGLAEFAQHMSNKIDAFNRSLEGGKGKAEPVSFDTKTPSGMVKAGAKGSSSVYLDQNNPNSVFLAKEALADAVATVELYNNVLRLYPQLGGTPMAMPTLSDAALKLNPPIPAAKPKPDAPEADVNSIEPVAVPAEQIDEDGSTPSSDTVSKPKAEPKTQAKPKRTWARSSENNYEVSTRGDKRFSALNAKLDDGRTIEEAFQLDVKGYRAKSNDWKAGKGKPPLNEMTQEESYEAYKDLWRQFLNQNQELAAELREKTEGKVLTDMFANTDISQARALAELLEEGPLEVERSDVQKSMDEINAEGKYTLIEISEEQHSAVKDVIGSQLVGLGFAADLLDQIVFGIVGLVAKENHSGRAFFKPKLISINTNLLNQPERSLYKKVITHELMHLIDEAARGAGKFFPSDNARLHVDGVIYNEVVAAMEANEALNKYFKYTMTHKNGPEDVFGSELFAELGTLYVHNPELLLEYIPNATLFVEAVFAKAGAVSDSIVVGTATEQSTSEEGGEATGTPAEGIAGETTEGVDGPLTSENTEVEITKLPQDLIKDKQKVSRFTRAYALKQGKSILSSLAQPLETIIKTFSSIESMNKMTGGRLDYLVESSQRLAFKKLMEENVPVLMEKLNARLTSTKFSKGMSVIETIKAGELDVPGIRPGKVANLINEVTEKYDQRLLEQAVMAAMNWALNSSTRPDRVPTAEKAAEIFHVLEDQVTPEMIQALAYGMSQTEAKESLATMIESFWGVERQNNVTLSDTRGISEALAAEIITVMEGDYVVTKEFGVTKGIYNDNTNETDTVEVNHLSVSFDVDSFKEIVESLGPMRTILGDIVMGEENKNRFFGEPSKKITKTQRRNKFSKNSASQMEALENLHQLEFKRNEPFLNMMSALGREAYMRIKGTVDLETTLVNKVDRKSIEGKNLSNAMSWDGVMEHDAALFEYANVKDLDPNSVGTFFRWEMTKVGRHMMLGFGPQQDKTSREALVATESTLDLNEDADKAFFWMTIGQSIGMKIEKKYRAENVVAAEAQMDAEYANSVSIMREWLNDQSQPLDAVDVAIIEQEMAAAGEGTDKAMHAILAVAMYRNALAAGGEAASQFEHKLSLEADGKTDGPINAMMHFISGRFEQVHFDLLAKGGFFMNQWNKTLNDHYQTDGVDLYELAATKFRESLADTVKTLRDTNSPALPYMEAIQRLTVAYSGTAISFDANGDLVIGRNILKNPLTVTVYGSGVKGINGKVVQALMEAMYANMTMELNGDQNATKFSQYEADINLLFGSKLYFWKGKYGINKAPTRISWSDKLADFEFTNEARANFEANMQLMFTDAMYKSINEMMGSTTDTMKTFQRATQIQSMVMMDWFKRRVTETLIEKYESGDLKGRFAVNGRENTGEKTKKGQPKYKRLKETFDTYDQAVKFAASADPAANATVGLEGEFLSQNEYDKIFKELEKFGAIVENDEYTLNMGSSETTESNRIFSSNLEDKLMGQARMPAPSSAGVKAAPYVTISRGDGVMINNIYRLENWLKKSLPVYDGVELAADRMNEDSALINKAVADGWAQNPAMDVSNSFSAFLRENPLEGLSQDTQLELMGIMDVAEDMISDGMNILNKDLVSIAQSIEARKMTIQQIMYSVDHMAGAESPFTNEDGVVLEGTSEEVLAQINVMYEANLARIQNKKPQAVLGKQDRPFRKMVQKFGFKNATNDVTELDREGFLSLMEATVGEMTSDQKKVYDVIKNSMHEETKFIIGSIEEVTAYRNRVYPEKNDGKDVPQGQIDVDNLLIYMTNQNVETALHEMVHATTLAKVSAYYTEKSALNQKEKEAIERMISLMADFMNRDFSNDSTAMRESALDAQGQIKDALKLENETARQVAALNEFMAWSLSNQELINAAKATRNRNPLAIIGEKLLRLMGRVVGGDIFSNILFNTEILVERPIQYSDLEGASSMVLNHLAGSSSRLSKLMNDFESKVAHWVRQRQIADPNAFPENEQLIYEAAAGDTINMLAANGFPMTDAEQSAYAAIQVGMATSMEIDPLVMQRSQRLYNHVISQITVESFMEDETDATQRPLAERKYRALTGKIGLETDNQGNSNLISIFLGLAQVNEEVRKILKDIKLPKSVDIDKSSADAFLYSLANSMMETLSITATKEGRHNGNVSEALDRLTIALGQIEKQDANRVEAIINPLLNKGDKKGAEILARVGEAVWQFGDTRIEANSSAVRKGIMNSAKTLGAFLNGERGGELAKATNSLMNLNNSGRVFKELLGDIIGMTDDNRAVLMMVNLGKKLVSATRQDFRETLPEVFKKQFSRPLTKEEQSIMHTAMGKTDLASMIGRMSVSDMVQLFRSNLKVIDEIRTVETKIKDLDNFHSNEYMRKSQQLANYMMTGVPGHNLLKNAKAISRLLNSDFTPQNITPELVEALDQLTTLYAIQKMDRASKDVMADLAENEATGIEFMMYYIKDLRDAEIKKGENYGNDIAVLNGYKGYIPSEAQGGTKLIITDAAGAIKKARLGYTEIGAYKGPGYRVGSQNMVYMYSTVSGRSTYSQGALQTVELAVNGIDPMTGRSLTGNTAGMITGPSVRVINRKMRSANQNQNIEEALMPIFDGSGAVIGFERALHPDMLARINRNTNLGEMIGAWRGRQSEEELGSAFNETLVDQLKKNWDDLKDSRSDEFIDMSNMGTEEDKILKDSWNMIPRSTKDYIESVFGDDGFPIQRRMVENVLGYRDVSVADVFTGENRLDEKTNKVIENSMRIFMGDKSMKYLVTGQVGVQTAVSYAKDLIIIKSVIVPTLNFASNIGQLLTRGVPAMFVLNSTRSKLVEINAYLKNQSRRVELEAIIKASASEPYKVRRAEVELQSMLDQERRMSIHSLIEAGEFSTISEGMTELDESLTNGKFADWTESVVNRFPGASRTVGKYALITRDTALYQGMSRAVQYGDFLGKSILYDHLMKTQGLSHEDALKRITEEFVNYNLLPGRVRGFSESIGLIWFQHFKVRSMKVALNMIRENPLRALLFSIGTPMNPVGMDVGSPLTDNLVSVTADGRLPYSIGYGMLWRAPSLNPFIGGFF